MLSRIKLCLLLGLLASGSLVGDTLAQAEGKQSARAGTVLPRTRELAGWVERVRITPGDVIINAKLDTGADISSINATDVEQFERGGQKWVRFKVLSRVGRSIGIERPVKRFALIKRHSGKNEKRIVVRLGLCIGSHLMEADVNLVDRGNFEHQMLVGRNFMAGHLVVDPANSFSIEPVCRDDETPK